MCQGILLKPFASPELAAAQGKEKNNNGKNEFFIFIIILEAKKYMYIMFFKWELFSD